MIQGVVIYAKKLERLVACYSVLGFETGEMKPEEYTQTIRQTA